MTFELESRAREATAALWEQFKGTNLERVAEVRRAAEAVERGQLDETLRAAGLRAAHQLAGSLGGYGLSQGTQLARDVERLLREARPRVAQPETALVHLAQALELALAEGPSLQDPVVDVAVPDPKRLLLVVEDDHELAD